MNQAFLARQALRRDIVEGYWESSVWLRPSELASRYGVGTSPLREALTTLAGEGLIETSANRGFRLKPLSRSDLEDIEWMRVTIETAALRASIRNGGMEWKSGVVSAMFCLKEITLTAAADKVGLDEWNDVHDDFHRAIIAACGSSRALEAQRRLADQHRRYRIFLMDTNIDRDDIIKQHSEIATSATDGDVELAVRLLEKNLRTTTEFYASVLEQREKNAK